MKSTNTLTITDFYHRYNEDGRLYRGCGILEKIRTKEILSRYLHSNDLNIADIGGGTGEYAIWLKKMGNHVSLVDLSPKHIEIVKERCHIEGIELECALVGNAMETHLESESFDIVLMLGPLYHLINSEERIKCLQEGSRILKQGGVLICSAISRYATLMYGYQHGSINDPDFQSIVKQDLETGIHIDHSGKDFFTDAYFHTVHDLEEELSMAGFQILKSIGIEGPFWWFNDIESHCNDETKLHQMLQYIKMVESEKEIIGASNHLLVVARK